MKRFSAFLGMNLVFFSLLFFNATPVQAQAADILEVVGAKYYVKVDEQEFRVLYGYGSSFEVSEEDMRKQSPDLVSMNLNVERKSLIIQFDNVHDSSLFWMLPDPELISAESYNFQVFVDGQNTRYDLVIQEKGARIGFVIPPGTENAEIIGTKVIPEFEFLVMVFISSAIPMVLISRFSKSVFN